MSAKLTVVYWRDIPSQVTAQRRRERHSVQLSERFQKAIDSAAMFAGKSKADAYMADWRKEVTECSDDLVSEAEHQAERLEAAFSDEALRQLIKSKGLESSLSTDTPATDTSTP